MRKLLDMLYVATFVGACLALIGLVALVSLQVGARILDRAAMFTGMQRFGFSVPSIAEIGGFLFVASVFLALPYSFRAAGHVRVTLLLRFLGPRGDGVATVLILGVAAGLACFAAWSIGVQTITSYQRGSASFGTIPIPLWIPQSIMCFGLAASLVAILDELAMALFGDGPMFRKIEREREIGEEGL